MNQHERTLSANKLKSVFNLSWEHALSKDGAISYRDMCRISDMLIQEGPSIMGTTKFPKLIHTSLQYAKATVDPNEVRSKETMKLAVAAGGGTAGLALAAVCLGTLLNPGLWAVVVTFFAGGIAGGPLAVFGVTAGLLLVVAAVYTALQKQSPRERALHAFKCVNTGIKKWVEHGDKEVQAERKDLDALIQHGRKLSEQAQINGAINTILFYVAESDNMVTPEKAKEIARIMSSTNNSIIEQDKAFEVLKHGLTEEQKVQFVDLCLSVALVDGTFDPSEQKKLRKVVTCIDVTQSLLSPTLKNLVY